MRLMISALLLASAAAAPALAQDRDHGGWHRDGGHQDGGDHQGRPGNGGGWQRPGPAPGQAPQAQPPQPQQPMQPGRPQGGGFGHDGRPGNDHGQPNVTWHNQPGGGAPGGVRPREGLWAGDRGDHGRPDGRWDGRPGGGNDHASGGWDHGRPGGWNPGRPGGGGDYGRPGGGNDHASGGWDHGRPGGWNAGRPGGGGDYGRPGGNWDRGGHGRDWNHDWRDDRRYDWRGWRDNHRDIYHVGRYRPPHGYGWGYRRYDVGVRLDPILFASSYWISDPWYYRLPPAYGPYRWVRYFNDALLVDVETGFVIDEIPDFFW